MTKSIPLHNGMVTMVDDADYEALACFSWSAVRSDSSFGCWYAMRSHKVAAGKTRPVYLHRVVLEARRGQIVDHRNRDGLDNRRENLRFATQSLNTANTRRPAPTSGYRGVYIQGRGFVARICVGGKMLGLGSYWSAEEAARKYDAAAREAFGDFATLNFAGGV